jgi:aminopeptidase
MASKTERALQEYAELAVRGGNSSLIHVDFMIGSDEMEVDGLTADDRFEPTIRKGGWAFNV